MKYLAGLSGEILKLRKPLTIDEKEDFQHYWRVISSSEEIKAEE
jgi:hypothetical protein